MLHLGGGCTVHDRDLILMTDLQRPAAPDTAALLAHHAEHGRILRLSETPKTLVLLRRGGETLCCLSGIGLRTLRRRAAAPLPDERTHTERGSDSAHQQRGRL